MSNIIFAVLFTDKYSITEIREQYGEQQHLYAIYFVFLRVFLDL